MEKWRKEWGGYTFDRRVFFVAGMILNIVLLLLLIDLRTHTPWYFECSVESPGPCGNPFYRDGYYDTMFCLLEGKDRQYCEPFVIMPGSSLGTPPSFLMRHEFEFAIMPIIIALLLNHFWHNRRFGLWKKLRSKD
jgi:hypothetical protein